MPSSKDNTVLVPPGVWDHLMTASVAVPNSVGRMHGPSQSHIELLIFLPQGKLVHSVSGHPNHTDGFDVNDFFNDSSVLNT